MILADSTSWTNPIAIATLVLALFTALMAKYTRRSVKAAEESLPEVKRSADAAAKAAKAAEDEVNVARDSLSRSGRPVLTDVPRKKYTVYGIDSSLPKVFVADSRTSVACEVEVPIQNIGQGAAVISHRDPVPMIQFVPDPNWYIGGVDTLILPGGESTMFRAHVNIVPKEDSRGGLTIYCCVSYTDLSGDEKADTYLCLMRDERVDDLEHHDVWSVHGVAVMRDGKLVHAGEGWEGFKPYEIVPRSPDAERAGT